MSGIGKPTAIGLSDPDPDDALSRIAELLGCPVEAFAVDAGHGGAAAEAAELLRLWFAIEIGEDRRKVLAMARALAKG